MKFKITLKVKEKGQLLPLSYQYELSSWLYKVIYKGDNEFASFLHDRGYELGKRRFKLFTFSRLYVSKFKIIGDRMKILCDEVSFVVSFFVDGAAQHLIMGLFKEEKFRLGDSITQVDFKVIGIDTQDFHITSNYVSLQTVSPLVVGKPIKKASGKLMNRYLKPTDEEFEKYFFQNLITKYLTAKSYDLMPAVDLNESLEFKLISKKVKMQGVKIKVHSPAATKIIGYSFQFSLSAPPELIELGMLAGFGIENACGFGATKIIYQN